MSQRDPTSDAQRFDLLVRSITDYAVYMLSPEGIVTNWNSGAERIKGYTSDEIVGRHFSQFFSPEDVETRLPWRSLDVARREGRYETEGWRVRKDGTRFWAMVVIDAIYDEGGELIGFAKVTRDITERRLAQQQLEETREQLFQSQKMEALGQLTGGLAHDFNNLLTAIMAGADLISRNADNPEKIARFASNIQTAAARGGSLTKQLLAFARRQPLEPRLIRLQSQLQVTGDLLEHSLPPGIRFELRVDEDIHQIEVDPGQLELAILNLGFNSRDAMPEGGSITLAARNVTFDKPYRGLQGEMVEIAVIDTGGGIPPEIRDRVLEPFFTTKSFGQGTGLGLSQAYGFADQSKGGLVIDSTPGQGTKVSIYLPVSHTLANEAGEPAAGVAPGAPGTIVLVVEDDPGIAELAEALLAELGFHATVVNSGAEALAALTRMDKLELLFSDVVMPGGMSGLELARRVRQRRPELPVLLTTGYSEIASEVTEFPLLPKPYQLSELADAINRALARRPMRL